MQPARTQKGFCTPSVLKTTNKRPHNKRRLKRKTRTNSLVATFLPNSKTKPEICVSKTKQPSCLFANRHCLRHNPPLTIGQPPLISTRHVSQIASGDCVHIIGELPAIIKIEDKTASGKEYVADSRHNPLGLDFIESPGLLDTPLNFVCNAVSRSTTQSAITDQTEDILKRFSPVFTSNLGRCNQDEATLALKHSTKPVFRPKLPVLYAALPLVDREMKRLEKMKVIAPVTYSQ